MMPDSSLGGYFEKHSRPPAFEGSDGASYSVDVYIEEDETTNKKYSAALIFVRWSSDGAQPVGHLETVPLAVAERRAEVKSALYALTLHQVKGHLERLIEERKGLPDW
ncbi:MAG: hypothetical protein IIB90_18005 [Gemmatimonadetes bacterium]|nr:hypothetical protein [Gemmatimonadota bacterium]MCH8937606.1 hypothetical protein [Gemmatimonadota bacterium]